MAAQSRFYFVSKWLKEQWPKGKKDGQWNWTDSIQMIENRLERFCKKYDVNPNGREIKICASRYLKDNNGIPKHLLKYFIYKDDKGATGIEYKSPLLNYLEDLKNNPEELNFSEYFL